MLLPASSYHWLAPPSWLKAGIASGRGGRDAPRDEQQEAPSRHIPARTSAFRSASLRLRYFRSLLKATPVRLSQKWGVFHCPLFPVFQNNQLPSPVCADSRPSDSPESSLWEAEFMPSKPIRCSFPGGRVSAGHRAGKPGAFCPASLAAGIRHINYQDTHAGLSHVSHCVSGSVAAT